MDPVTWCETTVGWSWWPWVCGAHARVPDCLMLMKLIVQALWGWRCGLDLHVKGSAPGK